MNETEPDKREMLALDRTTGLVHQYEGTAPGGIGHEKTDFGIGIIPCDCDGRHGTIFKYSVESDNVVMIERRHLEVGVWEPAPCLGNSD